MKKHIIICLLGIIAITGSIQAQVHGEKLEFGLGINPNLCWIRSNTKSLQNGGTSGAFGFGARINYRYSEKYALGFEINLQNVKASTHFSQVLVTKNGLTKESADFNLNYKLRYLEVPVLLKMRTEANDKRCYFGEFGMSFGYLLNQLADVQSDVINLENVNTLSPESGDEFSFAGINNPSYNYSYTVNRFRAGLIFGGGVQFILGNNSRLETGLRYNMGISDLLKEQKHDVNSHSVGLNVGFIF